MVNSCNTVYDLVFVREQDYVCPMQCGMYVYVNQQMFLVSIWFQHAYKNKGLLPPLADLCQFSVFMHLCYHEASKCRQQPMPEGDSVPS